MTKKAFDKIAEGLNEALEIVQRSDAAKCPFGCDEPWPHAPGGCVIRLDENAWAAFQKIMETPPSPPSPRLIEALKAHKEMSATLKRRGHADG